MEIYNFRPSYSFQYPFYFGASIMKYKNKGFSLLELMLVLVFIVGASAIAYKIFKPSQTQAAVRQEQQNVGKLVDGIMGAYSTANNFSTLSTATAAGVLNLPMGTNGLNSAMKTDVTVRPATSNTANDSFDLVYASLSPEKCIALIPALSSRSSAIFVGQRTQNLQNTRGDIANESLIATQCSESTTTSVTFRFRADKNTFASSTMDSCLCAPETETQTVACPANSAGSITQRRTGTCTGGTPACPSLQWSSWTTASNTCGANAAPVTPTTPVAPVAPQTCVPSVETQTVACPAGQVGGVLQQRSRACPANTWGAWSNVSSSCQPDPNRPACTPRTQRQTAACPSGQGGQIVQERASTCDVNGNEVWSNDWKNISSTCTASCVANGTCCTVSRQTSTDLQYCGAGNYGSIQRDLFRTSTCASATSTPVWPSAWSERSRTGNCTACPAPVQDQETQTVAASAACPAGQTGSHTWSSSQVRTRTRSYNCPDRTLNLPAPTIGAWSGWSEVARSGEVNTCSSQPMCSDGSAQVASWATYDSNTDYDYYQQIANADNGRGTRQSSSSYDQSFQVGNYSNSYTNLGNCTLNTLGAVGIGTDFSFECVSNMGMHYCDYNAQTEYSEAYRCVSACASSFNQYGIGQAVVDGQTRQVRRASDFRQLPWNQSSMSWGRPSYPGPNAPGGSGGGNDGQLYRSDATACEGNPYQQYDEYKWALKNPNGGVESGTCRVSRNGNTYIRTCSGTYNGQGVAAYTGDRDTAYSGLPYKNTWDPANTRTECVAGEYYENFSCSKGNSVSRSVASCNK